MSSVAGKTTWLYLLLGPLLASAFFSAVHLGLKPEQNIVEDVRGISLRIAAGGVLFVFIAAGIALIGYVLKRVPLYFAVLVALLPFALLWIMDLSVLTDPAQDYMRDVPYGVALTFAPTLVVWFFIRIVFGAAR